ncbi:MAG TPA: hypothetical protein EYG85_09595 [Crocinitomix sp.]|nr:hypothetical protein [Crocinitomix sp.]
MINLKYTTALIITLASVQLFGQEEEEFINVSEAEREISPSYRITEHPSVIDTVIPTPTIEYPLLDKSMETSITIQGIEPSKIKIVDKLNRLYPGYVKVGLGNYTMPLGELYYNSTRNRSSSYGVHLKHLSSFGNIKGYAPSQFDNTNGLVFGNFSTSNIKIESQLNWLNHGYHYYGIQNDSTIAKDSLKNRVGLYGGAVNFSNIVRKDSNRLLFNTGINYKYFHEFLKEGLPETNNAREQNFGINTNWKYKHQGNLFSLDADLILNSYKFGESDTSLLAYQKQEKNHIVHFRPTIMSYRFDNKLKAEVGFDLNFDLSANTVFKPIVVANASYILLNGMFIPYIGLDGGLTQNTYYSLNRGNIFINSAIDLKNTKTFKFYAGIRGTLSKTISFDLAFESIKWTDLPLYFNDTIFSDMYKFNVIYDEVTDLRFKGSISYQKNEKLKLDAIGEYNIYSTVYQKYAWNLPTVKFTFRGNYNLFDKFYVKADFTFMDGRKSPKGILNPDATQNETDNFNLGLIADANLGFEYRYNKRVSAFVQFNNIANQKYMLWYNYPVFGFQVLGGVTFAF